MYTVYTLRGFFNRMLYVYTVLLVSIKHMQTLRRVDQFATIKINSKTY